MALRFVCIHGHFYQPPREDPWTGRIEAQPSAAPYHDWNRRIAAECYAPNAGNYSRLSFNFGPTLLAWLEREDPSTYSAVLRADRCGAGAAIAQAYNHPILPLCNARDRRTQVLWGCRDFERRFGRPPIGMWLPETAVDLASLEALADAGIDFTVLAPSQAARVRPAGAGGWRDVSDGSVDPRRPYRLRLPSGRSIYLFFYDGPLSRAIAFEGLASDGEGLARCLVGALLRDRDEPQLVHVATDGETYGHHLPGGADALATALECLERRGDVELIHYGAFLERFPVTHEAEIVENSSWSCPHGLGRWTSNCGCAATEGRSQAWRAPLREALDWLRDGVAPRYEERGGRYLHDPWEARDAYVELLLDDSARARSAFFERHARRSLHAEEIEESLGLLELQRYAMLMYTSCAWFFDDVSRIETIQILQYAARVVQLASELLEYPVERGFLERLARAPSNLSDYGDARRVFELRVRPVMEAGRRGVRDSR